MKSTAYHQLFGAIFPIILGFLITRFIIQDSSIQYANAYSLVLAMLPIASIFEFGQDHQLISNVSRKLSLSQSVNINEFLVCLFFNITLLLILGHIVYSLYLLIYGHFAWAMIDYSTAIFLIISIIIARLFSSCESLFKAFNQYRQAAITRNIFPLLSSLLILILYATKASPNLYLPLLSAVLILALLACLAYIKQQLPLHAFNPSCILKLILTPNVTLNSLYGDSYALRVAMSYSVLSILINIYLQVPRMILLASAPTLVGLFIILQSITGKVHFLSGTLGELTLNHSIRDNFSNQLISLYRRYKPFKYVFLLLFAVSLYFVIPRRDGGLMFLGSIFCLSYSSVISSESVFYFYSNVVKQRFSLNLFAQLAASILVFLLAGSVYIIDQFYLISPYVILFAISAIILLSQIIICFIYYKFNNYQSKS